MSDRGRMRSDQAVAKGAKLTSRELYEVIRRDGEDELARPGGSLFWSGTAAGAMISLSILGEAIFRTHLADTSWRPLLENLGYSFGFLVVILGRMQLFTENTITTVLPLMGRPEPRLFLDVARLWALVLGANLLGTLLAAALFALSPALPAGMVPAIGELAAHVGGVGPWSGFVRAIPAGVIIAALVWILPQAREGSFFIILTFTWLIAAGDFMHVVAGSVEMWFLLLTGGIGVAGAALGFFLPVLAGNIVGGTAIFTVMAWGQVKEEVAD